MDHPWEKQPDEPNEAFAQFLIYLGLGPERTLQAAYQIYISDKHPGMHNAVVPVSFKNTAKTWDWERRAVAFNTHVFVTRGISASYSHMALIKELTEKLHDHVRNNFDKIAAKMSIPQLMEAISVLANHIPTLQGTVQLLQSSAVGARPLAIGGPGEPAVRDGPDFVREGSAEDGVRVE